MTMLNIPDLVKNLCKSDSVRKNFRAEFTSKRYADITNENLEEDSVRFDESLCQRNSLKFGLCEASSLQFTAVGMPNIKGEVIKCGYDIDVTPIKDLIEEAEYKTDLGYWSYYIPLGVFSIISCNKQADMNKRSVMAYSFEKITNFELPKSIQGLKAFTWFREEHLNFSGENLLDLVFPSYSYSRKTMTEAVPDRPAFGIFNFKAKGVNHTAQLFYYRVTVSPEGIPDSQVIFTYKTKYDPKAYDRKLAEANQYLKNLGYDGEIVWSFPYDNKPGEAWAECYDAPFSRYTYKDNYMVTYEGPLENEVISHEILLDNQPHTLFKMRRLITSDTLDRWSGSFIYKYENGQYAGMYQPKRDWGGSINIPAMIQIDDEIFDLGNGVEYNHDEVDESGILQISTSRVPSTIYSVKSSNPSKATKKIRTDYSFAPDIEAKMKINLREIIESYIELQGMLGHFNRDGIFELKKLNQNDGLYPSDTLYPSENLYPTEPMNLISASNYSEAWYDDEPTLPIKAVSATYKDMNNEEAYAEYHTVDTQVSDDVLEERTLSIQTVQGAKSSYIDWMSEGKTGPFEAGADIVFESTIPISSVVIEYNDEFGVMEEAGFVRFPAVNRFVITKDNNPNLIENADKILYITFKYASTQDTSAVIKSINLLEEPVIYEGDYLTYDVSNNYFIKNGNYKEEEMLSILEKVADNVKNLSYMPSSVKCIGLPYVEAGDWLTVITNDSGFNSVILSRSLNGIQTLKDSFESKGA